MGGPHHSADDIRDYIAARLEQFEANQGPNAGIWVDGEFGGAVGCHPIDWANRTCSIGYWIDAAHQGKGLMTRCCAALIDYLFTRWPSIASTIQCGTGNQEAAPFPSVWASPAKA